MTGPRSGRFAGYVPGCLLAAIGTLGATAIAERPMPSREPWLVIGGGSTPEFNQVSIEQDVALARKVLGARGVYFAGGAGSQGVQVKRAQQPKGLMSELGALFAPRGGRDSVYRPVMLPGAEPATEGGVSAAIRAAAQEARGSWGLYIAGHGDPGMTPAGNAVGLWGQGTLTVEALTRMLDASPRPSPTRLVVTTCFSGGFADFIFRDADPARGPASTTRCGVFSAPWDRPASGCDPNPKRTEQKGYGLLLLQALQGTDRQGIPLTAADVDFDGNGEISLLEAHSRARVASRTADIPTSTAERWLRYVAQDADYQAPVPEISDTATVFWPEEWGVVQGLTQQLGPLAPPQAKRGLEQGRARMEAAEEQLEDLRVEEETAYRNLSAALLGAWPVIDDPWHPDFWNMVQGHRLALRRFLDRAPTSVAYRQARMTLAVAEEALWSMQTSLAPLERLVRAFENLQLAGAIARRGGRALKHFEEILACERGALTDLKQR